MFPIYHIRNRHIPPNYVVERFICSSRAARGEDLQVEHPVCGGYSSAFHFYPKRVEENPFYGYYSTVNMKIIRELRSRISWTKTFVFVLTMDRESTDRCFFVINGISILQTKLCHREGHEARGVGPYAYERRQLGQRAADVFAALFAKQSAAMAK
jgi:hypothetical protein